MKGAIRKILRNLMISLATMTSFVASGQMTASDVPNGAFYLSEASSGWYYDVYLGVGTEPTYAGSRRRETELEGNARAFYVTPGGDRYYLSLGEVGGYWHLTDDLQFIAFVEFEEGRDESDDVILTGFDEIRSTLEGQFLLVQRWGNAYASVALQPDLLDRGKGLVWFVAIGHDWFVSDRLRFSLHLDVSGANSAYMNTEFGISSREAALSGLAFYQPSGGLKSLTTVLEAEYRFDKHWSLMSSLEWESYLDKAADSPLIKTEGDKNNWSASLFLRYVF